MTFLVDSQQLPSSLTSSSDGSSCAGPLYEFDYSHETRQLGVRKVGTPPCFDLTIRLDLPTKLNTNEIIATLIGKLAEQAQKPRTRFEYLYYDLEFAQRLSEFLLKQTQGYYDTVCLDALNSFQSFINAAPDNQPSSANREISHELFKMNLRTSNIKTYWNLINTKPFKLTNQAIRLNDDTKTLKCDYLLLDIDGSQLKQEQMFAKMYHYLMHSDAMLKLLEKERHFTIEYNQFLNEKEQTIKFLQEAYEANLNDKLKPENTYSDKYITDLAKSNLESIELEKAKWQSRANALKAAQQRKFRRFIQLLYDKKMNAENGADSVGVASNDDEELNDLIDEGDDTIFKPNPPRPAPVITPSSSKSSLQRSTSTALSGANSRLQTSASLRDFKKLNSMQSQSKLEESYTIQLGAQLKTTHNLRLIRCDILDYCQDRFNCQNASGGKMAGGDFLNFIEPHSIQTAMSLYSDKLCAVVLLINNSFETTRLSLNHSSSSSKDGSNDSNNNPNEGSASSSEISARFYEICERNGCDFHFQPLEQQVELAANWCDSITKSKTGEEKPKEAGVDSSAKLNIGDFFITKHSNLSQVHLMFHLACFDSNSPIIPGDSGSLKKSDLSSRHPVVLGLRNILKICVNNNINTLTFPLLLTHEKNEASPVDQSLTKEFTGQL